MSEIIKHAKAIKPEDLCTDCDHESETVPCPSHTADAHMDENDGPGVRLHSEHAKGPGIPVNEGPGVNMDSNDGPGANL